MGFDLMDKSYHQFGDWQNTSECIESLYSASIFDNWSMFTDKVASSTHSNKVLLCLKESKSAELLLYSYQNNPNPPLTLHSPKALQQKDVIGLNECIRLFPTASLPSTIIPSHCYFCKNYINFDHKIYQMTFAVSKKECQHIYNNKELIILLYLLPHLLSSLKSSLAYKDKLNRFNSLQQTMNLASKGIILYDQQAKIIFANQFMINQLINNDFMKIVDDDLVLSKQYENTRFHQLL